MVIVKFDQNLNQKFKYFEVQNLIVKEKFGSCAYENVKCQWFFR